jgi:hypothetical protein
VIGAGFGMVLSGLYRTDPDGAPTTSEQVHSLASGAATMALIAAAVTSLFLARAGSPRRAIGPVGALAVAALALGAISPVLHETEWTGLGQRALWLTLVAWLLLTTWQLAPPASDPRKYSTPSDALVRKSRGRTRDFVTKAKRSRA